MNNYSILVNTCDKFEDCWDPFFKLFSIYWPTYKWKIYLNTELKEYSYPNLNIIPLKVAESLQAGKILTWSECLMSALNKIEGEVILYLQEDYFIKDFVKYDTIEQYANLMHEYNDIHCIHLTDQAVVAENKESNYKGLYPVIRKQRYRISCQAALWRIDVLHSYLRRYENAWQFEEFGSKRSTLAKHNFYVVDNKLVKLNEFEIIPYIFTGIIQGKWYEEVIPLFEKNNIHIDYSKRGFVKNAIKKSFMSRFKNKIMRQPIFLLNAVNLAIIKFLSK